MPRIISLAPSVTEVLYALGVGDRLVAVSSRTAETQTSFESTHRLHVQNATTNTLVTLTPQYRQTSENYMVIYLGVGASDDVFTGGFVAITPR